MIFVGLKRYFISTISNHSLSVQLRVLTAETMEISASLNKLVVVKGQAGSTTEAVLFRSIFCKIRWEQQVPMNEPLRGRGYLPIFSRILLEKVGGTYLSLCNKNSDLNFLENFTRKGGRGYLPIFSRILLEKVGGTYLSLIF